MNKRWMLGRRSLLCALGLSLMVAAVPARTARATTCPKGSCLTNVDCGVSRCEPYTGIPVAGVCSFHCCVCPE
jgi:hypothetical protein